MNQIKCRSSIGMRRSSCGTSASLTRNSHSKQLIRVPSTKQLPSDFFGERSRQLSCVSIENSIKHDDLGFTFMATPQRQQPTRGKLILNRRPEARPLLLIRNTKSTQISKTRRRYDLKKKPPHRTYFMEVVL
jgi:hypothetical protein